MRLAYRPLSLKVVEYIIKANFEDLVFCATQLTNLPSDTSAANFNLWLTKTYGKIPFLVLHLPTIATADQRNWSSNHSMC